MVDIVAVFVDETRRLLKVSMGPRVLMGGHGRVWEGGIGAFEVAWLKHFGGIVEGGGYRGTIEGASRRESSAVSHGAMAHPRAQEAVQAVCRPTAARCFW